MNSLQISAYTETSNKCRIKRCYIPHFVFEGGPGQSCSPDAKESATCCTPFHGQVGAPLIGNSASLSPEPELFPEDAVLPIHFDAENKQHREETDTINSLGRLLGYLWSNLYGAFSEDQTSLHMVNQTSLTKQCQGTYKFVAH